MHEEEEEEANSLRILRRMTPEDQAIIESICQLNFPARGTRRRPFAKRGVFRMLS
jgi:hypothetical protein